MEAVLDMIQMRMVSSDGILNGNSSDTIMWSVTEILPHPY